MSNFSKNREILNKIPNKTLYCYEPDTQKNIKAKEEGEYGVYYIKPCPYYEHIDGLDGKCKLYNEEIVDQVKGCGLKLF